MNFPLIVYPNTIGYGFWPYFHTIIIDYEFSAIFGLFWPNLDFGLMFMVIP